MDKWIGWIRWIRWGGPKPAPPINVSTYQLINPRSRSQIIQSFSCSDSVPIFSPLKWKVLRQ